MPDALYTLSYYVHWDKSSLIFQMIITHCTRPLKLAFFFAIMRFYCIRNNQGLNCHLIGKEEIGLNPETSVVT